MADFFLVPAVLKITEPTEEEMYGGQAPAAQVEQAEEKQ